MSAISGDTLAALFLARVAATPNKEAFLSPNNGGWKSYTWTDTANVVRVAAAGLRSLGLRSEERVSILSGTRLEWIFADLAINCAGGATTTIYPSSTPDDCAYIIQNSDSRFVIAENADQVAKLLVHRADLPKVERVIAFEGGGGNDGWVIGWDDLLNQGSELDAKDPGAFERVAREVRAQHLSTLIYTSGTTGQPKGVMLTHDAWVYEGQGLVELDVLTEDDRQYLWLPLAHSFGKMLEAMQLTVGFSTAVDGRIDKMVENLAVIKPTFVCAVPRIFEKVHNRIVASGKEGGPLQAAIFSWAVGVGKQVSALRHAGKSPGAALALQHTVADRLVFRKIQARFGGRLRFFISGSAPLSKDIAQFFDGAGIVILEGYGLTETSAASFVNLPKKNKLGTVGPPFPGTQIKIAPEDGEVLVKGRGVMKGYYNLPDATAETFTQDGWLRTGDIGELDADGYLKITDRKKDLIKTSGGKFVAPQFLETKLKAICPYVSQVVIHGDGRKFISALITIEEEAVRKWAKSQPLNVHTYADLAADPAVHHLVQDYVDQLNRELPSYETVKQFHLLSADLTVEAGELTPSMKLKRKAVEKKYKAALDRMYESG